MKFSSKLRALRESRNLTQAELAEKLGISKSAISMYELGHRKPDFEMLDSIADALNVPMSFFFGNNKQDITFDDFTYAFHNEASNLTDAEKELLLSMARKLNEARKQDGKETD